MNQKKADSEIPNDSIRSETALAAARRMFGWAVERDIIASSPCDGVKAPAQERSRDRVLTDDEIRSAWIAFGTIGQPFGSLFKLLMLTGQRRDEVGEMRWSEVNLAGKIWTIPKERTKNAKEHAVPLSASAIELLMSQPRQEKVDLIFTTNGVRPVAGYSRVKERVDALMIGDDDKDALQRWTLHDLRRTFASGCARLGAAPQVVEAILNHKSGTIRGVAAVYNRYDYATEKRASLDVWARHVETIVSGWPAGNVIEMKAVRT